MTLTILGSGTSTGVPIPTCRCKVCRSRNPKNHRLRCSAWIQARSKSILIDTSTDLRTQALRAKISRIDAVLYTHPHSDHTHGIDELRCFNFSQRSEIPVYGNSWTCEDLAHRFGYIFQPKGPIEGGGIPRLQLNPFDPADYDLDRPLDILGIPIVPIALPHGSKESVGYRIESVAYVTDCSYIPNESLDRMRGLSVLVLDCVRLEPHGTHLNLDRALEVISQVKPKKAFLTHLGHDFEHSLWSRKLPKGVHLAYDGLKISFRATSESTDTRRKGSDYDRRRTEGN